MDEAVARRERIKAMMEESPPPSLRRICEREGMGIKVVRDIINDMGAFGRAYMDKNIRATSDEMPFGLTPATAHLRRKLGDLVYLVRERGDHKGPNSLAPRIGLGYQAQRRASEAPFNHDWKLSEIERLAQELGRDPRELIMSCLNA